MVQCFTTSAHLAKRFPDGRYTLNNIYFSCYIVGDDHLLPKCAKLLLKHGYKILGIVSPLAESQKLAIEHNIAYFDSLEAASPFISTASFDYLFSIVNSKILPQKIINRAKKMAINFHNAPLPRYAGVHALSWAILNDESNHGVTWHVMTEVIDGGDLLKQVIFPIDSDETSLSLSLKCYQYALTTFNELIDDLAKQRITRIHQNITQRSYYDFKQKPIGNGWISWNYAADNIERIVRALDLGHYHHNRLASPKLKLGETIFIISKLYLENEPSTEPPGTIIKTTKNAWYITTKTMLVRIEQLYTLDGQPCQLSTLASDYNIQPSSRLPIPTPIQLTHYEKFSQDSAKWELFWVDQLININRSKLPFQQQEQKKQTSGSLKCLAKLTLPQTTFYNSTTHLPSDYHSIDIILTAILIYLYRITSQTQLGIGLHSSPSHDIDIDEEISSFFAHLIPFSITLFKGLTFSESLQIVKAQRKIVESRSTYAKDIFYRYPELSKVDRGKYPIGILIGKNAQLKKQLSFTEASIVITLNSDNNEIAWWANDTLITHETNLSELIQNSIGHLHTLLTSLPKSDKHPISKLPLLSPKEREIILHRWNKTESPSLIDKTIIQLFEDQVSTTPNNIAVVYEKKALSYNELNIKANQLARYLQKQGLSPKTFGAIYTTQEIDLIIGILAILKTGAAYIPIDPHYPKQHIRFLLHDSKPKILLASRKVDEKVRSDCAKQHTAIFLFEAITDLIKDEINDNLPHHYITPKSLANIIYTSGTTGKPKGVMIPHEGIVRLVKNTNYIQIYAHDRIAQAASISFDAATFEIWGALLNGATLIAIPHATLLNISEFSSYLDKHAITILWLTSALFNQYAEKQPSMFKKLTYLLVGGDVLNKERVMSVLNCADGSPRYLLNGYGPTENTTFTTTHHISEQDKNLPSIPIGKPISNTYVYILDEELQPIPMGAIGELYTGGDGLAQGYLNRPELTQERFINNPFSDINETKLYKTGDQVCWLPNGTIEYFGRQDNQVKIRGFRVELSAIESCLLHHSMISQCVVQAHAVNEYSKVLVAYLVCTKEISDAEVQKFLAQQLPAYMIPTCFMRLNKFPLTTNGKVDHKKLPPPDLSKPIRTLDYAPPQTTQQKSLATLWCNLLSINDISIDDNFFDLGGHSLLITELILQLKEQYQADLSLHEFLDNPTIRHLSQLIGSNSSHHTQACANNHNLLADRLFPEDIRVEKLKYNPLPPKTILLTGATGFLGAYLLHDLYHGTKAKIYCLVREKHHLNAINRINLNLAKYDFNLTCNERIIPLVGDLSLPKLGLSDAQFTDLAETIDIIYHNGADVHHLYNYDLLRTVNVYSTLDIIRLATQNKLKSIHYVSTLSAASNFLDTERCIIEDFIPFNTSSPFPLDGYSQSKWVSEQLLSEASRQGVPVNIYRPGWILGQSDTGAIATEHNHLLMLIKGCIQLGAAPEWDVMLNILPVDIISQLITAISLDIKNKIHVFNMVNANSMPWIDLIHYLNQRGYAISLIDSTLWKEKHLNSIGPENALYALYALYANSQESDWIKNLSNISRVNSHNTNNALSTFNLTAPKIDNTLLTIYFNFLEQQGFIHNPNTL